MKDRSAVVTQSDTNGYAKNTHCAIRGKSVYATSTAYVRASAATKQPPCLQVKSRTHLLAVEHGREIVKQLHIESDAHLPHWARGAA